MIGLYINQIINPKAVNPHMDLFKVALNNGILSGPQGGYNYNTNQTQNQKLRQQLYHCTYNDDTKFMIEKAVKQVLHVYRTFTTQILQFVENGQKKRFLQIKGILEIEIRGKICKVDYNMMLPATFPKKAPYVRIINRNAQYTVDPFYKSLRSPTDPKSFILNEKLKTIKNWHENAGLVDIVMQSNQMMRQNFPFFKPSKINNQSQFNVNPGWNNINKQGGGGGWGTMNSGYNNNNNNNGWNNQGFDNGSGWNTNNNGWNNNQGWNNNANQGWNNQGGYVNPPPPIPFNNVNVNQVIASGQKHSGQSKKILQKIKTQHIKAVQKIQHLQTIKTCLESQQQYLRKQNIQMSEFLRKNQNSQLNNLTDLIRSKDDRSQQVLDLTSSIKARQDCIALLQQRFNNEEIGFQQLIKHVKRLEEQKFQQKALLAKCMQS